MKIVFVVTEANPGGAEKVILSLTKKLCELKHQTALIVLKPINHDSDIIKQFQNLSVPIFSLNLTKFTPWRIFNLPRILKKLSPDVVHSHLFHPNMLTRLFGFRRRYILINTVHNMEYRKLHHFRFHLDRMTFKWCDFYTAVAPGTAAFQAEKMHLDSRNIRIIENGIELPSRLTPDEISAVRQSWKLDNCRKILGGAGRLHVEKGFDRLFDVFNKLSSLIPPGETWGAVILGEGAERAKLEKAALNLPNNLKMIFPGYNREAPQQIGAFDLFLMPSRSEGFGLVLSEAMAHGIPILAQNIRCLADMLKNYPSGDVTDFENPMMAAAKIAELVKITSRIDASDIPDVDRMLKKYLELYQSGANKSG